MKEQDAAHSLNPEESLLVKMTAILNSIAREIDKNGASPAVKSLVDKGYHLSLEGIEHLGVLDKQAAELTRLRSELQQEREAVRKFVFGWDKFFGDPKVGQPPSLEPLRELIKKQS